MTWATRRLPGPYDLLAPDGSEIRLLVSLPTASMVHCTLQPGQVTRAVRHRTVDELWLCLSGLGQLWRRRAEAEEIVEVQADVALSIPVGTAFQFRAIGDEPLRLIIATTPPWPGEREAEPVPGAWPSTYPASA